MKVIGISTSTARGSVALVDGARLLGEVAYHGPMHHAERLFGALDELLDTAGVHRSSLAAIACDVGPGSFTGVRAGLAAAKGIAFGLGRPLCPVGALEAMAAAAWSDRGAERAERAACVVDARRGEIFWAVYDRSLALLDGPDHLRADQAAAVAARAPWAGPRLCWVGEQARRLPLDAALLLDHSDPCRLPGAAWVARLGAARAAQGALPPLEQVDAVYVRPPDAVPAARR